MLLGTIISSTSNKPRIDLTQVKLANAVEGDQKALFSIVTILRCKGGCYTLSWNAPLYPKTVSYNAKQGGIK